LINWHKRLLQKQQEGYRKLRILSLNPADHPSESTPRTVRIGILTLL
jgi:hypothetical protein